MVLLTSNWRKISSDQFVEMSCRTMNDLSWIIDMLLNYRGVGAMEIVAMDMKVSGMYIARQLSFSGVSFRIEEIGLDSEFKVVYNKAAKLVSVTHLITEEENISHIMIVFAEERILSKISYSPVTYHIYECVSSGPKLCKSSCVRLMSLAWSAGSLCGGSSGHLTSASSNTSVLLPRSAAWWSWPKESWRLERSAQQIKHLVIYYVLS